MSLFGALAIGAIEAFLYIRFFQRTRAPKQASKSERQRRVVSGSKVKPQPKAQSANLLISEKGAS